MKCWMILLMCVLAACASDNRKLVLDGEAARPTEKCGVHSYLNRYANYRCSSLELENSNEYVNQATPIHNIKNVVSSHDQKLLVIDEKIFGAQVRQKDQEVMCNRRLKVVLNPGAGQREIYQKGWITYRPKCFQFYRMKPDSNKNQKKLIGSFL